MKDVCFLVQNETYPSLDTCHLTVSSSDTGGLSQSVLGSPITDCDSEGDWWINFVPTDLRSQYEFLFIVEGFTVLASSDYHPWVDSWAYGIVEGTMKKIIYAMDCKHNYYCFSDFLNSVYCLLYSVILFTKLSLIDISRIFWCIFILHTALFKQSHRLKHFNRHVACFFSHHCVH